jgi:hypothetical protein
MEDAFMADIVIAKGLRIFQLLPAIDETQWIVGPIIAAAVIDTLANASTTRSQRSDFGAWKKKKNHSHITNLSLDVVDSTIGHHVKCHGLSSQRFYENLHDCERRNDGRTLSKLKHEFICC